MDTARLMVICTIISTEGVGENIPHWKYVKYLVIYKRFRPFHLPPIGFKLETHNKLKISRWWFLLARNFGILRQLYSVERVNYGIYVQSGKVILIRNLTYLAFESDIIST